MAIGAGIAVLMFYFIPAFGITPKTNLFIDAAVASNFLVALENGLSKKIITKC